MTSPLIRTAPVSTKAPSSKRYKMSEESSVNIGFIGGGNLARAITEGLLKAGK